MILAAGLDRRLAAGGGDADGVAQHRRAAGGDRAGRPLLAEGLAGFAFGLKFILAFGISGLGVQMEGMLYDLTGGFHALFMVLAAVAVVGFAACFLLPPERRQTRDRFGSRSGRIGGGVGRVSRDAQALASICERWAPPNSRGYSIFGQRSMITLSPAASARSAAALVAYAELHPDGPDAQAVLQRDRLVDDAAGSDAVAEDVDQIDRARHFGEPGEDRFAVDLASRRGRG